MGAHQDDRDDRGDATARAEAVLAELAGLGSEEARAGMGRYGINTADAYGVSLYVLRPLAKQLGRDHDLALALWATGNHEARLLASMVDDAAQVTVEQMDAWAAQFDSWDVCDQVTSNLFDKTPFAYDKVHEWSSAEDEWIKRAAFATAAALAVQDKQATDEPFLEILELRRCEAGDDRNRQEGGQLGPAATSASRTCGRHGRGHPGRGRGACCRRSQDRAARSGRWIARDAPREPRSDKVIERVRRRG